MNTKIILKKLWIAFFILTTLVYSQTADSLESPPVRPQQIELKTFVEMSSVPLNRPVIFRVQLSWRGELTRYQIEPISQPVLTNLLLEGSGSENKIEPLENGEFLATKALTYQLKPLEMGMAYIDGVKIKYRDSLTGEEDQLASQRVMVEITEPLPEPGKLNYASLLYLALLAVFLFILVYFILKYFKKRKQARELPAESVSMAQIYLDRLAKEIDPRGTNLNEMISRLSKLIREYLAGQFKLQTRGASSSEIISQIENINLDESSKNSLKTVFEKLEIIQFTGKNVDQSDFSVVFGTVETFLIKQKQFQEAEPKEVK